MKMRINVKLYGECKKHAPGDRNDFMLKIEPGTTLADVLTTLSIPQDFHVALVNGRRATKEFKFKTGDILVLFPAISGG